jgi:hypothetical protein
LSVFTPLDRSTPCSHQSQSGCIQDVSKLTVKDPTLLRDACLVAGEWVAADSGGTVAVHPSTGAVLGNVPNMWTAETRRAIEFASAALPVWRAKTARTHGCTDQCCKREESPCQSSVVHTGPKGEVAPFDERSVVQPDTSVAKRRLCDTYMALLSHTASCVYRKLKPGRNDGEPADQPTSPLAIRVGRMQTVQRKKADRVKQ